METTFLKFFLWTRKMKGWHTHRKKFNQGLKIHLSLSELDSKISPNFFSRPNSIRKRRKKFWHPLRKKATSFSLENQKWLMKKFFFKNSFPRCFHLGTSYAVLITRPKFFRQKLGTFFLEGREGRKKLISFRQKFFTSKYYHGHVDRLLDDAAKNFWQKSKKWKSFGHTGNTTNKEKRFYLKTTACFLKFFLLTRITQFWQPRRRKLHEGLKIHHSLSKVIPKFPQKTFPRQNVHVDTQNDVSTSPPKTKRHKAYSFSCNGQKWWKKRCFLLKSLFLKVFLWMPVMHFWQAGQSVSFRRCKIFRWKSEKFKKRYFHRKLDSFLQKVLQNT